jgi:hypothetical protein
LESTKVDDNTMLAAEQQSAYEVPESFNQPVLETPNSELVVARENTTDTTWETPPELVEVPAEAARADAAQAEQLPMRKQEWL